MLCEELNEQLKSCFDLKALEKIRDRYFELLGEKRFPDIIQNGSEIESFLNDIKREPHDIGPYKKISMFEAANRIASDITLMDGLISILSDASMNGARARILLGIMHRPGCGDFEIESDGKTVYGEVFNVANSLFKDKLRKTLKKWNQSQSLLKYIVFNADLNLRPYDDVTTICDKYFGRWTATESCTRKSVILSTQ